MRIFKNKKNLTHTFKLLYTIKHYILIKQCLYTTNNIHSKLIVTTSVVNKVDQLLRKKQTTINKIFA